MDLVTFIIQKVSGWIDSLIVSSKDYTRYIILMLILIAVGGILKVRLNLGATK